MTVVAADLDVDLDLDSWKISEDELTALALAADPDAPLDPGARPDPRLAESGMLPQSYLPSAMGGHRERRVSLTLVSALIIAALLTITVLGFCNTYGQLGPA